MPRNFIKRYLPHPERVRDHKSLRFLGEILHEPNLWHINRHSIARAFLIGLFWMMIPIPLQMLAAALCAIWINGNLPLSVALVWISNPLTMPPIFYFNYRFGALLLGREPLPYEFEFSLSWMGQRLMEIGLPLYLGSLVLGVFLGCTGYLTIQFLWRRHIRRHLRRRQLARRRREASRY